MANDPCATCGGTGTIHCNHCGGSGINRNSSLLDDECCGCQGSGQETCQLCHGTGEWQKTAAASNHPKLIELVRSGDARVRNKGDQ